MEDKHTNYLTCNRCAPTGLFYYSVDQFLGYEWFMNNVSCVGSCKKHLY